MLNIIIAAFQILPCIVIIVFWIYFFLVENKNPENSELYLAFEKSFPLAEFSWVVPCLLIAAIGLLTEQKYGFFFSIAGGSALLFIGLLDISFNIQNKGYTTKKSNAIMEIIFNSFSVLFGIIFIIYGWANL